MRITLGYITVSSKTVLCSVDALTIFPLYRIVNWANAGLKFHLANLAKQQKMF